MKFIMILAVLTTLMVHGIAAQACVFPSQLRGEWTSTVPLWDNLQITDKIIGDLPVDNRQLPFTCFLQNGSTFLIESPEMFLSSIRYHFYTCLDIVPAESNSDVVYFHVRTVPNTAENNYTVLAVVEDINKTFENVCQTPPTQFPWHYDVFLKTGFENRLGNVSCPRSLHAEFEANFTEDLSYSQCPDGFILNGCDLNNIVFNYTVCNGTQTSMGAPEYKCLNTMHVDNVTYTTIINQATVDGGQANAFQTACLEERGSVDGQTMVTKSGGKCGGATSVMMTLNETRSCRQAITESPETTTEPGRNGTTPAAGSGTGDGGQGDGGFTNDSTILTTASPGFAMLLLSTLICALQIVSL